MGRKYHVLIVEDEMLVRIGIQSLINWDELGLILLGDAENGEKGLEYFKDRVRVPDIVVMDINMPVMDGIEMMRNVREMGYENCIFIVLTVLEDFDYARKALQLGAFDYIPKFGMTKENLTETLLKAIKKMQDIYDVRYTEISGKELSLSNIMQGFLQLHRYTDQELLELLQKQGGGLEKGHFLCAAACVKDSVQEKDEKDSFVNMALLNTINDLLSAWETGCVYVGEDDIYHFVFSVESRERQAIEVLFEKIQDIIQLYFNCRLQIGCSSWGNHLEELPLLMEEGKKALDINYFWNLYDCLFWGEDFSDRLIRYCLREIKKVELAGEVKDNAGKKEESIRSMDMENINVQKQQLIHLEYVAFHTALQEREISFSVNEQLLLYAEVEGKKCAQKITKVFLSNLEKKLNEWRRGIEETRELRLAMDYIKKNYQNNITISQIADMVGYSPGYLTSVFKKKNGKTAMEYLNWYRVEKAKELIRQSGMKSYEIAEKVGFSDPNYFSRIFKKYVGKSVNEYKRNQ